MRGNVGGGGGFFLGYMAAQNPAATGAVAVIAAVALVIGGIVHHTAVQMDLPDREPIVTQIVEDSLATCSNAFENSTLYTTDLNDGLMSVWSSDLQNLQQTHGDVSICVDDGLNQFVLPYDYNEVGTQYTGEYRVMGVVYTQTDGTQVFVVKPDSDLIPENAIDDRPDARLKMSKILDSLQNIPEDIYQHTLEDGTQVAVYLQHDGVTQEDGSRDIHDNDGKGWANEDLVSQIQEHYSFALPTAKTYSAIPNVMTPQI